MITYSVTPTLKGGSMAREKRMYVGWIIASILLIAVGLIMLVKDNLFEEILIGTLSSLILISSLVSLFTLKRYQEKRLAFGGTIVKGVSGLIVSILALVLLITGSNGSWALMLVLLASQAVLAALILLIDVFVLKKGVHRRKPLLIEALVSVLIAVALFLLPSDIASLIRTLVGVMGIVIGIAGIIISALFMRSKGEAETNLSVE